MKPPSQSDREHQPPAHPDNIKCPHCGIDRSDRILTQSRRVAVSEVRFHLEQVMSSV